MKRITKKKFRAAMGRDPQQDELDRCNCAAAGTVGHWGCGWCEEHNKPRFSCACLQRQMGTHLPRPPAVTLAVPVRMGSDAPRGPEGPKVTRPLDEVEREMVFADMRYLIEKEKESGDWDKWQKSQRYWDGRDRPRLMVERDARGRFRSRGDR